MNNKNSIYGARASKIAKIIGAEFLEGREADDISLEQCLRILRYPLSYSAELIEKIAQNTVVKLGSDISTAKLIARKFVGPAQTFKDKA